MIRRLHLLALHVYRHLPLRARRRVVRSIAPGFTVGAMCCIERADGQVLLVQQSYREVREEVGIDIVLTGEPAVVVDAEARRVDLVFRARLAPGQDPALARPGSPEIVDARWFPADDLPELQHETSGAFVALARSARHPQAVALPTSGTA